MSIAKHLRTIVGETPIIAITRYNKDHRLIAELSVERSFDGIIPKAFIESDSLRKVDLFNLIESARQKAFKMPHASLAVTIASRGALSENQAEEKTIELPNSPGKQQRSRVVPQREQCDVAIMCALQEPEFARLKAVNSELTWNELRLRDSHTYWTGELTTAHGNRLRLVAGVPSLIGLTPSAILATKMVLTFQPKLLLLVGIAAGTKADKRGYGDILIPQQVIDYSSGKLTQDQSGEIRFAPDPHPVSVPQPILALFQNKGNEYLDEIRRLWPAKTPETALGIHIGSIASGDAVVASTKTLESIKAHWRKLIGVEMEAYAVYRSALEASPQVPLFAAIKAVCDFADESKNDDWQEYAAFTAAQYCYRILKNDLDHLIL